MKRCSINLDIFKKKCSTLLMLPGIAAFVLYQNGNLPHLVGGKDRAYSSILAFLGSIE
jgi:hypothetical protein